MAKPIRNPRPGCIEIVPTKHGTRYELTELGLAQILELSTIGSGVSEIADYLRVSETWLEDKLREDDDGDARARQAYMDGAAEFRKRLRVVQMNLAETSAPMAIFLGEQHLGQRRNPVDININKKVQVLIGTTPDYEQTPEQWQRQFAPENALKQIEAAPIAEDAEVVTETEAEDDAA